MYRLLCLSKSWLSILFFLSTIPVQAQNNEVRFNKTLHNWGDIISSDHVPACFMFFNTTKKPVTIISARGDGDIRITYSHRYVQPGDTGFLYVSIQSERKGEFTKNIEVYLNTSDKPISLIIKGNIMSVVECFADPKNWEIRKILIIDSITKEPISIAETHFINISNGRKITEQCKKTEKCTAQLPIGLYEIEIMANGYRTYRTTRHIKKTDPILVFELGKTSKEEIESNKNSVKEIIALPEKEKIVEPTKIVDNSIALPKEKYNSNNIVFLIDISKSMQSRNKFGILKENLKVLFSALRDIDKVSLIVYNTQSTILLQSIDGSNHNALITTIDTIKPSGFTNGVLGLEKAYTLANTFFTPDANNQIILSTDGEFSDGKGSEQTMNNIIIQNARKGIRLSIVGFAETKSIMDNLQKMAFAGMGHFLLIENSIDKQILLDEIKQMSVRE